MFAFTSFYCRFLAMCSCSFYSPLPPTERSLCSTPYCSKVLRTKVVLKVVSGSTFLWGTRYCPQRAGLVTPRTAAWPTADGDGDKKMNPFIKPASIARIFELARKHYTVDQWEEWLRTPFELAGFEGDRELAFRAVTRRGSRRPPSTAANTIS